MLYHILDTRDIERDLEELVLAKTEGIPFYLEEFVKSLKDLKIIEKREKYCLVKDIHDLAIPSSIQDVIMARVDALPEGAREALQTGSVIEREFSFELIKKVMDQVENDLLSNLSVLKDSELIYERGIYPDATYIFRHAIAREVVYDSILSTRKKSIHNTTGNAIEKLYPDKIEEYFEILVEHFLASENYQKGADYSNLASKKAEKSALFVNAITYDKKRISCLESLTQTEEVQKQIIDARSRLGLYYTQLNYFTESKEAVDPVVELAQTLNYKKRQSQIYTILGTYYNIVEEDFPKGNKYLDEAVSIAEEEKNIVSLFFAHIWTGLCLPYQGEFEEAYYHLKKALDINIMRKSLSGIAGSKGFISVFVYYNNGSINEAYQTGEEAVKTAVESGDAWSKGIAYCALGAACFGKGLFDKAISHLLKAIEFSERSNLYLWNCFSHEYLGEVYFELGEYLASENYFLKGLQIMEQHEELPTMKNFIKIASIRAGLLNKQKDINLDLLHSHLKNIKCNNYDGLSKRYLAGVYYNIDDNHLPEAENWIKKAIEADRKNSMIFYLAQDYLLYYKILKKMDDAKKAKDYLGRAIEQFRECGSDGWVERYEKELVELQ